MKNNYFKRPEAFQDERPIPEPDEQLYNNPDENIPLTFKSKVKYFTKSQKNQNSEK